MTRVAVGVITRRRPEMLDVLLSSFLELEGTESQDLLFIIVENDSRPSLTDLLARFSARHGHEVVYELEPEPGIPFARNRVLDIALRLDVDLLAFVDDDERVQPDWLSELTSAMHDRQLDLAGGPLRLEATGGELTAMQRAILTERQNRLAEQNRTRATASGEGVDGVFDVYTNNWCARLSKVRELGLRFDEKLRDTGGSDTAFSKEMRSRGGSVGWVPSAVVHDRLPARRLTPGYTYRRSRDQATVAAQRLNRKPITSIRRAIERALRGCLQVAAAPVRGRASLAAAIYSFGNAAGRLRAAFGRSSRHYSEASRTDHID